MSRRQERELILIVEDDPHVSEMLHTYLRTKQYRLITTPMGEEAIELCRKERPSVVLLDINLPDIDGYEVSRRLRADLATQSLPVIFLTQKHEREHRLAALQTGDDFITKPFDMEELYLRIRNAVHQARYRAGIDRVSGLPGAPLVEAQLKTLLQRTEWAVLLVSVEGFERFERAYGHLVEKFVEYVAQLVRDVVDQAGNFEDFCGRVDVVQYVVVTTPSRVADLRARI